MKFEFAKITKSRLMGSLGLHIKWQDEKETLNQFFLLDAEEDGIADYVGLRNASLKDIFIEENRLMGGLGSSIIRITKKKRLTYCMNMQELILKARCLFQEIF
jgi:hypothetical protein